MRKYNQTVENVFWLLKFIISKNNFTLDDAIKYLLEKNINVESETILKYIRTLCKAGFEFKKTNNKVYVLRSLPNKIDFSQNDKNIILKIGQILCNYLITEDTSLIDKILRPSANKDIRIKIEKIRKESKNSDFINLIEKYCKDKQRLQLSTNQNEKISIEPKNILINKKGIFLNGFDIKNKENISLNVNDIKSVKQTPVKNKFFIKQSEIILKFSSRLAKSYVLKPGEQLLNREKDCIYVKSFYYDKEQTFRNILRYMNYCEIISPSIMRKGFFSYLENLYQMYDCPKQK